MLDFSQDQKPEFTCYATVVIGTSFSGKTFFINNMLNYLDMQQRSSCAVNLDPSTEENFDFPIIDVRQFYHFKDFLENYGPKEALLACMDLILQDDEWFNEFIFRQNVKYIFFDMPSPMNVLLQIGVLPRLINILRSVNCSVCIAYLLDSLLITDPFSFLGGILFSMSTISIFDVPHLNILTKFDLLNENQEKNINAFLHSSYEEKSKIYSSNPNLSRLNLLKLIYENGFFEKFIQFDVSDQSSIANTLKLLDEILCYIPEENEETFESDNQKDEKEYTDDLEWVKHNIS